MRRPSSFRQSCSCTKGGIARILRLYLKALGEILRGQAGPGGSASR